nr:Chain C, GP41 PEPTIDE [Human immunodeficiency virus 1]
ALDKWAS